ncbi:hypothetical protein EZS27_033363, partial [termite gut metagenome]
TKDKPDTDNELKYQCGFAKQISRPFAAFAPVDRGA